MIDTEGVLTGEQKRERDKEVFAFLTMEWERSPKWDEPFYYDNYGEIEEVIPSENPNGFVQIGDALLCLGMTDEEMQEAWDNSQIGQMWNKYADEDGCITTDTKSIWWSVNDIGGHFPVTVEDLDPNSAYSDCPETSESFLSVEKALLRDYPDDVTVPYDFDNDPFYDEDITGVVIW